MSRISENIRKITRAWGGKTTGNGISDALSDLYNNLPFGAKTEMVEIVPEQSVTGEEQNGICMLMPEETLFTLTEGKTYKIVINGKSYESVCKLVDVGNKNMVIGDTEGYTNQSINPDVPFILSYNTQNNGNTYNEIAWLAELGETITFAIYSEQMVTKPLAQEFIPNIAYFKDAGYDNALMGVATADLPESNLSCLNMTFEQAVQHIMSGKPLMGVVQHVNGGPAITIVRSMVLGNTDGQFVISIFIPYADNSELGFEWSASGIEQY